MTMSTGADAVARAEKVMDAMDSSPARQISHLTMSVDAGNGTVDRVHVARSGVRDVKGDHPRGAVLDAGSVLLALTSATELVAFKPSNKEYTELARIKVADTPTWAYPIIAGNRVFVKDRDALTLWMIP